VETVAGTGQQSHEYFKTGPATTIGLNSPWDVQLVGRTLYIAMAGPHQVWQLDLEKKVVSTYAGSGPEARLDGELLKAGFAQPSGITSDGQSLYTADSEANIIRAIDLNHGQVRTLVGGDLFEFGDKDGHGDEVRLQHPLGIVAYGSKLLIADTYNHKIKELDPASKTVKTFLGTGKPGQAEGATPSFYEPGGLSVANGMLYVADTNNHAVRVIDLKTKQTSTLRIKGLEPPDMVTARVSENENGPNAEENRVGTQQLNADTAGSLTINLQLPDGYHLNPAAPHRYRISIESGPKQLRLGSDSFTDVVSSSLKNPQLPLRIPIRSFAPGAAELRVQFSFVYCREDDTGTCRIKTLVWRVPVEVQNNPNASHNIKVTGKVAAE